MLGIIDRYLKRQFSAKLVPVKSGFENVARDIQHLQHHMTQMHYHTGSWHSYLHQRSQEVDEKVRRLHADLRQYQDVRAKEIVEQLKGDIAEIRAAIKHEKNEELVKLGEDFVHLKKHLSQIFEQYNSHIVRLNNRIHVLEQEGKETAALVRKEIEKALAEVVLPTPSESKSEGKELREVKPLRSVAQELTPAEKSLLAILASTEQKLSYKDLAVEYGKAPSTVKTILCSLKKVNIPVREVVSDGIKRFYLDEQYKKIILSKQL